jgi:hypothetical protein
MALMKVGTFEKEIVGEQNLSIGIVKLHQTNVRTTNVSNYAKSSEKFHQPQS